MEERKYSDLLYLVPESRKPASIADMHACGIKRYSEFYNKDLIKLISML